MAHPVYQGHDLADHFSVAGDAVVVEIVIRVLASGAMHIQGPVNDLPWMLAALDHAKDAVRNQHKPKETLIIPAHDVELPGE